VEYIEINRPDEHVRVLVQRGCVDSSACRIVTLWFEFWICIGCISSPTNTGMLQWTE
jgi:hypothetical protein